MNVAELAQKVHDLPELVKAEAVECIRRNAELMAGLAQIYVHVESGALRDSIHVEQQGDDVAVIAGSSTVPYAKQIEAKFPYMEPAWSQVEPRLKAELEAIQRRIDEHFSG